MQHKVVLSTSGAVNSVWGRGNGRQHKVVLNAVGAGNKAWGEEWVCSKK